MKYSLIWLLLLLMYCASFAQRRKVDSLRNAVKNQQNDTSKVKTLNILSEKLWLNSQYDTSMICANDAQVLAEKLDFKNGLAGALGNKGVIYWYKGNYAQSLECYFKALPINQKIGNKLNIIANLGNIGLVYQYQENDAKALEYYLKALSLAQQLGDKERIATNMSNIGSIYYNEKKDSQAMEYYSKGMVLYQEIGDKQGIAINLMNIGGIYDDQRNIPKALENMLNALPIYRQVGDANGIAGDFSNIGSLYTIQRNYVKAKTYFDSALMLAQKIGDINDIVRIYNHLSTFDSATGNYKMEVEDYKKFIVYKDSLLNEATNKRILQAQMNYVFDRKTDSAKAAQDKLNLIAAKESQHQKMLLNSFIGGFVLLLILVFFIFRGYRQKQKANIAITKQKKEIEIQKSIVDEKNKEVQDSILYAKRLQDAILPPLNLIKKNLPESFVLYKPKDIVAGDFYWMEKTEDAIFIAAADCTGHGVPGALVSVVCSNALNRTVKEFHITEPGKILDKVTELVLETFEKSESKVQDGMDISLCFINTKTNEVQWSGAYNALWYIQNGILKIIPPDKQPVGKFERQKPFSSHTIHLSKGDSLYLFTDGYADQFGGPKGKKFQYKQLEEKLLAMTKLPMEDQKNMLETTLEEWKGGLEQVDDILVIGIQV